MSDFPAIGHEIAVAVSGGDASVLGLFLNVGKAIAIGVAVGRLPAEWVVLVADFAEVLDAVGICVTPKFGGAFDVIAEIVVVAVELDEAGDLGSGKGTVVNGEAVDFSP